MEHVGMDLGKKESQIAIITEAGELVEKRIRTERERLTQYFKDRPKAKILMEASTISEWVARLLEELGHEVVVADPNYAPMYAQRSRRVKTDKRDALALGEACKLGAYRAAHRTSDEQRHVRALLTGRDKLVRTRAGLARGHPQKAARDAAAAGVDGAHRSPPWPARRCRGPGPQAQRDPLRDVAGRIGVRPREAERRAAQQGRAGGLRSKRREPCVALS